MRVWRVPAMPMSLAIARIESMAGLAASNEPASAMARTMCTAMMPCEWPITATGCAWATS